MPVQVERSKGIYLTQDLYQLLSMQQDWADTAFPVWQTEQADGKLVKPGQTHQTKVCYEEEEVVFEFRVADDATVVLWKIKFNALPNWQADN